MIKKSLLFTLFLSIAWTLCISFMPFSISQHQLQDNIIVAEKFIFDIDSLDNLIVGSSLARRLEMEQLEDFYNLSLNGQSVFDGLNILSNKKELPKTVYIETNVIVRGADANFNGIVSSPVLNSLKRYLKIFRTDQQPLAVVNIMSRRLLLKLHNEDEVPTAKKEGVKKESSYNSLFDKMLQQHIVDYTEEIDSLKMDAKFQVLAGHINYLKSNDVRIVFFEMPVNPQLNDLARATYLRNRILNDYPDIEFIQLPDNLASYHTTDGIHLTDEEATRYTQYFDAKSKALN